MQKYVCGEAIKNTIQDPDWPGSVWYFLLLLNKNGCSGNHGRFPGLLQKYAAGCRKDPVLWKEFFPGQALSYRLPDSVGLVNFPGQRQMVLKFCVREPVLRIRLHHNPIPYLRPVLPAQNGNRTWYSGILWFYGRRRICCGKNCLSSVFFFCLSAGQICCGNQSGRRSRVSFCAGGTLPQDRLPLPRSCGLSRV